MPRFFFHHQNGDQLISDEEGLDLPDLGAAREEAEASARKMLAEIIKIGGGRYH